MVSIMPGMENFAPERTLTSSGFSPLPSFWPCSSSKLLERGIHLAFDFGGDTVGAHVFPASLGLDGEAGRHGQPGIGHLGEAGAFAAEVIFHLAVAVGLAAAKGVNVLGAGILVRGLKLVSGRVCVAIMSVLPLLFRRFFGFLAFSHDFGEIGNGGKFF